MACSCRTAALQVFVRSVAQVHAPTTQHVRSAWLKASPRFASHNIPVFSNYRRAYTTAGSRDADAEEPREQPVRPEDQQKPQSAQDPPVPSESSTEDERLFSITRKSKNAIRKAKRYSGQSPENREQAKQNEEQAKQDEEQAKQNQEQAERRPEEVQKSKDGSGGKTGKIRRVNTDRKPRDRENGGRWAMTGRTERQSTSDKTREPRDDDRPLWLKQKQALKEKFPEGWRPPKRLSPDALEGIRVLHSQFPDMYTTEALAEKFEVSAEAIRRILKSKWEPSAEEDEDRQQRWFKRGVSVWQRYAELGRRPPRRWLEAGVEVGPREKQFDEEEDVVAEKVDLEKERRLQARSRLSNNLV